MLVAFIGSWLCQTCCLYPICESIIKHLSKDILFIIFVLERKVCRLCKLDTNEGAVLGSQLRSRVGFYSCDKIPKKTTSKRKDLYSFVISEVSVLETLLWVWVEAVKACGRGGCSPHAIQEAEINKKASETCTIQRCVLVSFSVAVLKQPNKSNLKRERFYFGLDFQNNITHHGGEEMTMGGEGMMVGS